MTMYVGLGVMSGMSMDGLDICCVELTGDEEADHWKYKVIQAETEPYSPAWRARLQASHTVSGEDLIQLHTDYGHLIGQTVRTFMDNNPEIDDIKFISVHGHTVFHQPDRKFTFQLGDGETIASHVEVPVLTNFRAKDVAHGGQGSPLMLVGEKHLFSECNMFLNLGGICNVSVGGISDVTAGEVKAFDVVPCNMMLNHLCESLSPGQSYDEDGQVAATGSVIPELLNKLNNLHYYEQHPPKTLSREWFDKQVIPLLDTKAYSVADLLRTCTEHITVQIMKALSLHARDNSDEPVRLENVLLITGGAALNTYLRRSLCEKLAQLAVPITVCDVDRDTILYKEAIILSFIGLRTLLGQTSTQASATGARCAAVSGSIHLPSSGQVMPPHLNKVCPFHIMRKKSRASTVSFGSTEQLEIPIPPVSVLLEDDPRLMEEPRRMKRTLTN